MDFARVLQCIFCELSHKEAERESERVRQLERLCEIQRERERSIVLARIQVVLLSD